MQQKLSPLALSAAICLVLAILARSTLAQYPPGQPPGGAFGGYGPNAKVYPAPVDQRIVPLPPTRPEPVRHPGAWPQDRRGNPAQPAQHLHTPHPASPENGPAPDQQAPVGADMKRIEGTRFIGRVGSEVILEVEATAGIDDMLEKNKDKIPPGQMELQRELLIRQRLENLIETKLIYLDAQQTIPAENFPNLEENLSKHFEEQELKNLLKRAKLETRRELDQKYRDLGSSLHREKRAFMQRTLARQWIRQQVKYDQEVTYDEMLDYYYAHQDDFRYQARVRWEELMVRFSKHPDRAAARAAVARMGNHVLAGAPLAQVARAESEGTTAGKGGLRDWTTKGSLVAEQIDRALFGLPPGQLSPILESKSGYHIVRVVEREDVYCTPFLEAQVEIEPKIRQQRTAKQLKEYIGGLRQRIPVWTVFDDQPAGRRDSGVLR